MKEQKRRPGRPKGSKNKVVKSDKTNGTVPAKGRVRDEIWAIIIMAVGAFLVISLQTEAAGEFGRIISDLLKGLFGLVAFALPYYLILYGILLFLKRAAHISGRSLFFFVLILLMAAIINSARFLPEELGSWSLPYLRDAFDAGVSLDGGGAFGMSMGLWITKAIGVPGLYLFCSVVILVSVLLVINTPFSDFFDRWKEKRNAAKQKRANEESNASTPAAESDRPVATPHVASAPIVPITPGQMKIIDYVKDEGLFDQDVAPKPGLGLEKPVPKPEIKAGDIKLEIHPPDPTIPYRKPPIDLLSRSTAISLPGESGNLKAKAVKLEQTLKDFGVNAKVLQVTKGPAITRYEIQPNVGVKVSSIVRLADDIALNLEAKSIRIEAPIPGKAAVGIEVENERVNLVVLREIIESKEYTEAKSKITFAVGKDISGNPIVSNLKDMPHLLIAGSTGSGKSVCLNSLIVSMLYRATPAEVKFVLIDPKVVELGNYNGIPHLLIPVVTEPTKAAAALHWAVAEMTDRYKKFAEVGVRDLESYNEHIVTNETEGKPLPQIVIIIDELADLMMVAPAQVEESICRLAQMARAAGMHLIVATQRPSVDVITGVIKANIPSRISFAVSSQFDSRTILDMGGAEKLVGKGDMLFCPLGMSKPIRVQGAFISDSEVHKVIDFLKKQGVGNEYSSDVMHRIEKSHESGPDDDSDDILPDAIETVVRAEQASVSMLQRRFRIGYNRAARLIDMMEARGIIGPSDGSRPRKVLISEEQYLALYRDPDSDSE
jgi:S-DNA-T family DNA segregation ATPase FtsK/SpoIIIE